MFGAKTQAGQNVKGGEATLEESPRAKGKFQRKQKVAWLRIGGNAQQTEKQMKIDDRGWRAVFRRPDQRL